MSRTPLAALMATLACTHCAAPQPPVTQGGAGHAGEAAVVLGTGSGGQVDDATPGAGTAGQGTGGSDAGLAGPGPGQTSSSHLTVWTRHNDNNRTGANLQETWLTTDNVHLSTFGKLFNRRVDGSIQAQPLYVGGLFFPQDQASHEAVFVATMNNGVYAFDATDAAQADPLWHVSLGAPVPVADYHYTYAGSELAVGILGTPVIDTASNTLYVVAATREGDSHVHRLHALDLYTGAEQANSPVLIVGLVAGNARDASGGRVAFDSLMHLQSPALLLAGGQVFVGFGSHGEATPYHGWMFAYDAKSLQQTGIYASTPNSIGGGFSQSGEGPAADGTGAIYGVTDKGFGADATQPSERSESLVRLHSDKTSLALVDWFTPATWQQLDSADLAVGSGVVLLVPNSTLAITGSRSGTVYLLDRTALGHIVDQDAQIVQRFMGASHANQSFFSAPVLWHGPLGTTLYMAAQGDTTKAFGLIDGRLQPEPLSQSSSLGPSGAELPGGTLSISAHGAQAKTGIVWEVVLAGAGPGSSGILRALDASDLSQELYSSQRGAIRDALPSLSPFCPPTVVNGHVYVATPKDGLAVFGLLPRAR